MPKHSQIEPGTVPEIAHRMRLLRAYTGLSQNEFAKRIGVARNVWSNVEGEFGRIGIDTAVKLHRKFSIPLDWIYLGDERLMPHGLMTRIHELDAEGAGDRERKCA